MLEKIKKKNSKHKSILLIYPEGNLLNNPSIYAFTKFMIGKGYKFEISQTDKPSEEK